MKRDGFAAMGSAAGLEKEGKVKGKENVGRQREGLKAKGRTCGVVVVKEKGGVVRAGCRQRRGESLWL